MTEKKLQPYPFHDGGAKDNLPIRMRRMAVPYCPSDSRPELLDKSGNAFPNPHYTGEENCQEVYKLNNMGRWDVEKCESLGHEPYYTTLRRKVIEEVIDDDGFVTESKVRVKVTRRLNVMPIPISVRHATWKSMELAVARGAKPLEEFGYMTPCDYRQCSQPVKIKTQYGDYCSERHARLIAADARGVLLPISADTGGETADKTEMEREDLLESIRLQTTSV